MPASMGGWTKRMGIVWPCIGDAGRQIQYETHNNYILFYMEPGAIPIGPELFLLLLFEIAE